MTQSHVQHGGGSPGPDGASVPSVSLSGRQTGTRPVAVSQVGQDDADWWDVGGYLAQWKDAHQAGRNSLTAAGGGSVAGMVVRCQSRPGGGPI